MTEYSWKIEIFTGEGTMHIKNIPLSCCTSPLSIFSSFFKFDSSASSLTRFCFACSISFFLKMTPSWYVAIFFFNLSLATLPASQQVFGHFTLPSYSSLPSQQSAHQKPRKQMHRPRTWNIILYLCQEWETTHRIRS